MFTLTCVKPGCGAKYQSEDEDPYYCEPCNTLRIEIAKELEQKLASQPKGPRAPSALQIYDASPKVRGFMRAQ